MLILDGESLARITIAEPWGLETTNGLSEFEVNESDLINERLAKTRAPWCQVLGHLVYIPSANVS